MAERRRREEKKTDDKKRGSESLANDFTQELRNCDGSSFPLATPFLALRPDVSVKMVSQFSLANSQSCRKFASFVSFFKILSKNIKE